MKHSQQSFKGKAKAAEFNNRFGSSSHRKQAKSFSIVSKNTSIEATTFSLQRYLRGLVANQRKI